MKQSDIGLTDKLPRNGQIYHRMVGTCLAYPNLEPLVNVSKATFRFVSTTNTGQAYVNTTFKWKCGKHETRTNGYHPPGPRNMNTALITVGGVCDPPLNILRPPHHVGDSVCHNRPTRWICIPCPPQFQVHWGQLQLGQDQLWYIGKHLATGAPVHLPHHSVHQAPQCQQNKCKSLLCLSASWLLQVWWNMACLGTNGIYK